MQDDTRPPPTTGTPEGAAWFRAELEALGQTQSGFARWMEKRGDDRRPGTILRHIQRMANGEARVSGEMRVILSMMRAGMEKKRRKAAPEMPDAAYDKGYQAWAAGRDLSANPYPEDQMPEHHEWLTGWHTGANL